MKYKYINLSLFNWILNPTYLLGGVGGVLNNFRADNTTITVDTNLYTSDATTL